MHDRRRNYMHNIPAARSLRQSETATELLLWELLRGRRLHGCKFRRQHAIGKYVVDFYCHELRLVVEIDGGVHETPEQQTSDRIRQADIEETGVSFLRIPTSLVQHDLQTVIRRLESHIRSLRSAT